MDWNNDGRKDLIIGESYNLGKIRIYLNQGADANPVFSGFSFLQVGTSDFSAEYQATPEIVDWNNDGRKDVLCGHVDGEIYLLLNTGTDTNPSFSASTFIQNGGADLNVGYRSCPVATDWNRDGRKDLLVGTSDGRVYYFENRNTDANPLFNGYSPLAAGAVTIAVGSYARPAVADMNGDGIDDLLVGDGDGGVWRFEAVNPNAPYLDLVDSLLNDSSGNTNAVLDPGETAQITVRLTNSAAVAHNVTAVLSATSPLITIINPHSSLGDIAHGQTALNSMLPFSVSIASDAPQAAFYAFVLEVSCEGQPTSRRLGFTVGGYALNSGAPFSWIDASGGTSLGLGDESLAQVNLGFGFPFFGRTWTQVYVCDNGYLTFGSPVCQWANDPIPTPGTPDPLIAPLWDDFDPGSGGSVRCAWGGSAPSRYLVVEWNQVPRYSTAGQFTFEAVLRENGAIRFQYGPMSGGYADGSAATIGLEDDGVGALQYSCKRPGAVWDGLAIEFDMSVPRVDSDADGLPDPFERFYFPVANADGNQDADGDGLCNWKEIRAGTDPTDARSVLAVTGVNRPSATQAIVEWQSVPGKLYAVQSCTGLPCQAWGTLPPCPVGGNAAGMNCFTATVRGLSQVMYRIGVP